jgi:hypothetical protein
METKITEEQSKRILEKLGDAGFKVFSFGTSFNNMFEEISLEYFNEKINEVLND